ncbi:hypothetical protein [Acidovorax sp.]|uniref:hypothetical protein n=1 Tax=Acidovorax sp. TaxID=1872122 RepID=UPI0026226496|nr:hypothetical protein [Acidovorax sp.]
MSSPIGVGMGRMASLQGTTGIEPRPQAARAAEASLEAPVSLTLPPPPRSEVSAGQADRVRTVAQEPARAGVAPSRADVAQGKLKAAGGKLLEARQAGVDVAKTSFWKKALGVALSGVAVGVAVGLTTISFGGATPLLALACVNFAVSTGDAMCAYRNMRNTEAIAEFRTPPYEKLPMGNSIVGNMTHGVLTRLGVSAENATVAAKVTGGVVTLGLVVASLAVGAGLSDMPMAYDVAGKAASLIGTGVAVASTVVSLMTDAGDREELQESLDEIRKDVVSRQEPESGRTELDADGQMVAAAILRSMDGQDTATALHGDALNDAARVKEAVSGASGVLKGAATAVSVVEVLNMVRA